MALWAGWPGRRPVAGVEIPSAEADPTNSSGSSYDTPTAATSVIRLGTEFKLLATLCTVQITFDVVGPLKVTGVDDQSSFAHGRSYRGNDLVQKARSINADVPEEVIAR